MDIFDVLTVVSERKITFMHSGMNEQEARIKANLDVSKEYHILLLDIKKLVGERDPVQTGSPQGISCSFSKFLVL
jgi:hypothetical protein